MEQSALNSHSPASLPLPAGLAGRTRIEDGTLHLSAELRGHPDLDLYLARCGRTASGMPACLWHAPQEYERRWGQKQDTQAMACAGAEVSQSWVNSYVRALFERAIAKKASDIHITYMGPYAQVSFRRMGLMTDEECLDGSLGLRLIRGIFQGGMSQAESGFSEYERYDGRIADRHALPEGLYAVRLHTEPIQSPLIPRPGVTLAMRLLYDTKPVTGSVSQRLAALGFTMEQTELVASFCETGGMTVISGPTGHGKTTVLKNILEAQAQEKPTRAYYSLEDPPEYTMLGVRQLNVHTRAVSDQERRRGLLEALAGLMRSDPDVILLGEVRYLEAAEAAVNATLTGHSVWTTVHAASGLAVIARLHEMGLPLTSLLGEGVLTGLTYQRLMPMLCPNCSLPLKGHEYRLSASLNARLARVFGSEAEKIRLRGAGCSECGHLGLVGQQVAAEVIALRDPGLRRLLRENRLADAQQYWIEELGGLTCLAHARARVARGEVDPALAEERLGTTLDADLLLPAGPMAPVQNQGTDSAVRKNKDGTRAGDRRKSA